MRIATHIATHTEEFRECPSKSPNTAYQATTSQLTGCTNRLISVSVLPGSAWNNNNAAKNACSLFSSPLSLLLPIPQESQTHPLTSCGLLSLFSTPAMCLSTCSLERPISGNLTWEPTPNSALSSASPQQPTLQERRG